MQLYQLVDMRLAGRQAPDIFRIQYQQVGRYASAHALVDLTLHLDQGYASQFGPAFWQAVTFQDKQFALPHHTDTLRSITMSISCATSESRCRAASTTA
jgi:multiple sugar transport system substrate-binding protein